MLAYRPQSGRLGRVARAACLALLVPLSFGGCSGCDCLDLGNLNCGFTDTTCWLFCPTGAGGGVSTTLVGGAGGGTPPKGLSVALDLGPDFTPFEAVRLDDADGYYVSGAGPLGLGLYRCSSKGCGRVDGHAQWGFPASFDTLDDTSLRVIDASPNASDDSAQLFSVTVGSQPVPIDLGGFVPRAIARGVVQGKTRFYLSGIDGSGQPAVGYSSGEPGPPQVVYLGPPLADPAALTVDAHGVVFVIENLGPDGRAALYRIEHHAATALLTGLDVGYPSGVAFDPSSGTLLVLVRDPLIGTTRLLRLDTDGTNLERFGETLFGAAQEPGGVHGPSRDGTFAIVDSSAHEVFALR
jgi:hypothetical protein